jgi:hypothetical protein
MKDKSKKTELNDAVVGELPEQEALNRRHTEHSHVDDNYLYDYDQDDDERWEELYDDIFQEKQAEKGRRSNKRAEKNYEY